MKLALVVPAYNEAACVARVLRDVPAESVSQIIVVDNGSTDDTAAIARACGAQVVREERRGYGQACFVGTTHVREDIEAIGFLDADGSDDPKQLPLLLEPIARGQADLVVSARTVGDAQQNLTPQQRFGNRLAVGLIRLLWGHRYTDLGPMRVIRRDALQRLDLRERTWGWPVEMQLKAIEQHLRIREIPVPYAKRFAGKSKISGTLAGTVGAGSKILSMIGGRWLTARSKYLLWLGLLVECAALAWMVPNGDFRLPGHALHFMMAAAVAMAGYAAACWSLPGRRATSTGIGWASAVIFRLMLLPMFPSDDMWRYMWEGKILNLGYDIWALAPANQTLAPFRDAVWPLINHPHLAAIYPLATETVFRVLAATWYHPVCFKAAFVAADLGAVYLCGRLVGHLGLGKHRVWWYAWNPLVIYVFAGGGHFDSLMIACGLASLLLLLRKREAASILLLGLAIAFKLGYLLAIPFYAVALKRKAWLLLLLPVLILILAPRARFPTHPWLTYNLFLPSAVVFGVGVVVLYRRFLRRPVDGTHHVLTWTVLTSSVFHPWYLPWVLSLSPLVGVRAPWVWSASAFSYFLMWDWFARTGVLEPGWTMRIGIYAPFLLFFAWERWRGRAPA
jgi:hypothetical protein